MNPLVLQVAESTTLKVADKVRELEMLKRSIIKLHVGDPNFSTSSIIIDAAYLAMRSGYTHYGSSRGLNELREVISEKLHRENGLTFNSATDVLVTHGASHALFITFQALLSPGDEVLLLEPYYMSYESSVRIAGGIAVTVPSDPISGFRIDPEMISSRITPKTKMIVINSPCNPSGVVLRKDELQEICDLAIKHNLIVISDEVYEKLIFNGNVHYSIAAFPGMTDRTVTINSLSKTYAMTGWRIGYLATSKSIATQILKVLQYSATNINPFIQMGAITALTHSEININIESMRAEYNRRRNLGLEAISSINGVSALAPEGAFYLMLNISSCRLGSIEFALRLIDEFSVAVVPGVAFGHSTEGWIRLAFSSSSKELIEGISRIGSFMERHSIGRAKIL